MSEWVKIEDALPESGQSGVLYSLVENRPNSYSFRFVTFSQVSGKFNCVHSDDVLKVVEWQDPSLSALVDNEKVRR